MTRLRPTFVALALLWPALGAPLQADAPPAKTAKAVTNKWELDIQRFEASDRKQFPPTNAVLFVGSSSFAWWSTLAQDMQPFVAIPRGFGGSTAADAIHFADRIILPYKPRTLVLYEGANDIVGQPPPATLADVSRLVAKVHASLPATRLLLVAVRASRARDVLTIEQCMVNRLLLELAEKDERIGFVDGTTPLLDGDGLANTNLLVADGLHLNPEGYALWGPLIKAALAAVDAGVVPRPRGLQRLPVTVYFDRSVCAGQPATLELPVANRGDRELIFSGRWRLAADSGGTTEPATIASLRVPPGETRTATFRLALAAPGALPPVFDWEATDGRDTLGGHAPVLTLPGGHYAQAAPAAAPALLRLEAASQVKPFRAPGWSGTNDCSAMAAVRRSATGLSLEVSVRDDAPSSGATNAWENDAVEFFFDFRPASRRLSMWRTPGCLQVIAVPAGGGVATNTLSFFSEPGNVPVEGATLTSQRTDHGYDLTLFLPFAGLARAGHGAVGETFFFDVAVDDADGPSGLRQQIRWAGSKADHLSPGYWGLLSPP